MNKLPVLLSIPHGGTKSPKEIDDILQLSKKDIFDDIDPYVIEIYDVGSKVQKIVSTQIARTFVDLNRSLQDMPPKNPDGLIKSMTCYKKPIYVSGKEPDENLRSKLIELYYKPYHREIQRSFSELDLQLGIDCHSMASFAPGIAPDDEKKSRPLFCISNQNGNTCSKEMLELLSNSISKSFSIDSDEIKFNEPFKGGYITKTYGNNPIPWIQVEMNRKMYLSEPWFDSASLTIEPSHLKELNKMFAESLDVFFGKINI